jgi:glucokinase
VGATNLRFAIREPDGALSTSRVYSTQAYASLQDAIEAYLDGQPISGRPAEGAIAIAGVVGGDQVKMTNHAWDLSISGLREQLRMRRLVAVNDASANAMAVPLLAEDDRTQIGSGNVAPSSPIGVIAPGTGLGVSGNFPFGDSFKVIASEGGHVTMSPANRKEDEVLEILRRRFDHVSAERVLSGPGLVNLYTALCKLAGVDAAALSPAQITDPGTNNSQAREATEMFCAMLGTVAGNLALTLAAKGGIYIAGGIVPRLGTRFARSQFRERFEAKGTLHAYVAGIPTFVIVRPSPALLGLAKLLESNEQVLARGARRIRRSGSGPGLG